MFSFFSNRPLIEENQMDWQFECFKWLLRNTGGYSTLINGALVVQPTENHFPMGGGNNTEIAEALFRQTKEHAGMSNWPCRIQAQDADPSPIVAPFVVLQGAPNSPAGTFSFNKGQGEYIISYNPESVSNPMSLIATFAHELGHYLNSTFTEEPPEGIEYLEYATDITLVFLGFGIFGANSCFNFSQYTNVESQGWQTSRQGYLSEPELLNAHAIYSCLIGSPLSETLPHLKSSLRSQYKQAYKYISAELAHKIEELKSIQAVAPAANICLAAQSTQPSQQSPDFGSFKVNYLVGCSTSIASPPAKPQANIKIEAQL